MNEVVERVAQAMWLDFVFNGGFPSPHPTWDEMADGDPTKQEVRSNARAALKAFRDVGPELFGLAADKAQETRGNGATWPYSYREGHRAMIDAILSENPKPAG